MIYQTYPWGGVYSKSEVDTRLNDYIPKAGGAVLGHAFSRTVDDDYLAINGSSTAENGAFLRLHGKNYDDTPWAGTVLIRAKNDSSVYDLFLKPDGTAKWGNKNLAMQEDVIPRSGGAVITGINMYRNNTAEGLNIGGGTAWYTGAIVSVQGAENRDQPGYVFIQPAVSQIVKSWMYLLPNGTWSWSGTACQITSDQRLKQQITQIDNALLDAWEDVNLVQFKYNDAVNEKGDNARLHTGYVVQQIDTACKSHNVDISAYGLYCHEEYPERTEEVEVTQDDGSIKKETKVIEEASEHYSLRYTEIYAIECAYLRRENNRLKERLSKIEKLLNI